MKKLGTLFSILLFLTTASGQEFAVKVTSDLVLLDVSVKSAKGGYVADLSKENFRVFEDGKLQTISQFSREDTPVTVGLVIDSSGSMTPKYSQVVTAALVFIAASNPKDEIFVINFNDTVTLGLPPNLLFTDDIGKLSSALSMGRPEGRTALYDAMALALSHLEKGQRDKKTLVLVSDGGNNHSYHTLDDVKRMALASRATIYTIELFDESDKERNPGVLRKLSGLTGGETYAPKDTSDVLGICRQVAKDIRARYTIGYVPARNEQHSLRKIKVVASQPEGQKLTVRTRTSYMVPQSPETR